MSVIDDLRNTIDRYETDNCKTEIINYSLESGMGSVLNVSDTFRFKVKVTNESHLDMKNVKVQAVGSAYADVALSTGTFGSSKTSGVFNLDAHQSYTTGYFRGKAKAVTGAKDIVTARIYCWDASFDHILKDHTGYGEKEGKLNKEIKPI